MKRVPAALSLSVCLICTLSHAHALGQEPQMTVAMLKEKGARQLTRNELERLLPGAKVTHKLVNGSTRTWQNGVDGQLVGFVSDAHGMTGPFSAQGAIGKWHINDKGEWCVNITWAQSRNTENWCRALHAVENKYYGAAISTMSKPATPVGSYSFDR